jgi:hypothetical protein
MKFSLKKGKRYKASIVLGMFERMAGNEQIAAELRNVGFSNITISGQGGVRYVVASWDRPDADRDIPRQVHEIIELRPVLVKPEVPPGPFPPPPDVPAPKGVPLKPIPPIYDEEPLPPKPWWKVW